MRMRRDLTGAQYRLTVLACDVKICNPVAVHNNRSPWDETMSAVRVNGNAANARTKGGASA